MTHEQNGTAQEAAVTTEDESRQFLQTQGYCPYGHYPWDYWEKRALGAGVSEELARLGRAVMREAHQHAWSEPLRAVCGWNDRGEAMIVLAQQTPEQASFVWQELLETDGCRGSYDEKTGEWISWL
jgi:hypothetical protein